MNTNYEKEPISLDKQIEKDHEATQEQLFQSTLEDFKNRLSDAGVECVEDGQFLRLKKEDKQVGIVFRISEDNRTVVRLDSDLQTIIEEFESSIPSDSIFTVDHSEDLTDFTFFPSLTKEEATALQTEIEPIDKHIVVVQGEYVIMNKQDEINLVSSFGMGPCRGIIIYDHENEMAAVAHSDTEYADTSLIEQMRTDLIKAGANSANLKFYGTPNIDSQKKQYIIDELFSETTYEIPSDFTFNCTTGLISSFDIKSLPQSENLDQRLDDVGIRLKHGIPYIKKEIKEFIAERKN